MKNDEYFFNYEMQPGIHLNKIEYETDNIKPLISIITSYYNANEYMWQMPLFPRDQKALRNSDVADLNNAPIGKPGAIMAAAFLKEFVEDTPWIHLDIAGTADSKTAYDLGPKGGTGVMVRTIAKYLELQG